LNQKLSFETLESIFRLSLVEKSLEMMIQWLDLSSFFFLFAKKVARGGGGWRRCEWRRRLGNDPLFG
jgi:hypothetical protein